MGRKLIMPALALALVMAASCSEGPLGSDESRVTVLLTDAPAVLSEAVVTINAVYLQGSVEEDPESGRFYLLEEPVTVDLTTLVNTTTELAEGVVVPAGTYGQLRVVIDGMYIVVDEDGQLRTFSTPDYPEAPEEVDGELKCPSCSQSGFKVNLVGGLSFESDQEVLLIDFDMGESLGREAGNSEMWVLSPVIKATMVAMAASLDVGLSLGEGVELPMIEAITPELSDFSAELLGAEAEEGVQGEMVPFSDPEETGMFGARFMNIVPGDYVIKIHGPEGLVLTLSPAVPFPITIGSGEEAQQAFVLTGAVLDEGG